MANWISGPQSWITAKLGSWLADTNHSAGLSAAGVMGWLASASVPPVEDLEGDALPLHLWRLRALADAGVGVSWWEDAETLGWLLEDVPLLKPAATPNAPAVTFALAVAALEDEIHLAEEAVDVTTGTRVGVLGVVAAARAGWAADEAEWWDDTENAWVRRLGLSDAERLALRSPNGLPTADVHDADGFDDVHENVLRSRPMWSLRLLWRAERLVASARRIGVDLRAVTDALAPDATADDAAVLRTALRDARGPAAWPDVAQVVMDRVREQRRDATVQALLRMHRFWRDETDLFRAFLFDPMVNAPVQTSRTLFAMLAVQAYVQRVLLGLESLQDPLPAEFRERWTWMREYRVWEAARKVFLFPENWIDPELLLSKTPEFEAAERLLRSGTITEEGIESAYIAYLQGLTDVANLTIVSFVTDTPYEAHGRRSFAVLGRQRSETGGYFLRRRTALGDWTPWRRLDFDPPNGPVALYHDGRGLQIVQVTLLGVPEDEDGRESGLPKPGVVEVRATIFPIQGDRLGTPQVVEGNIVVVDGMTRGIGRMDRKVSLLGIRPGESAFEPFVTRAASGKWTAARWQDLMRRGPAIAIAMEIRHPEIRQTVSDTMLLGWLAPAACGNGWAFEAAVPSERSLDLNEVNAYSMWTDTTLAVRNTKARSSRLVAEGQDVNGRRPLQLATNLFQVKNSHVLGRGAVEQLYRPFRVTLPTDTRLRRTWIAGFAGGFAGAAVGPGGGMQAGIGAVASILGAAGVADLAETEDLFFHDDQGRAYTVTTELRRTAAAGTASLIAESAGLEDEELTTVVDLGQDVFDRYRDLEPSVLVEPSSSYGSTPAKDVVLDEETPLTAQLAVFSQLSTVTSEG
jgi:outer membrane lipoprotein SlyB